MFDGSQDEEGTMPVFCRALYDYSGEDGSALSFRKGDIIEVLTKQPSGWWDGLLGDDRGWFPSNYVMLLDEQETERIMAENFPDAFVAISPQQVALPTASTSTAGVMSASTSSSTTVVSTSVPAAVASAPAPASAADFWVPQVTPTGQIFYVNTQTGQQSRDLPVDADDEELGFVPESPVSPVAPAGFGLPRRTDTPEPWEKKLADDGMVYYYFNKIDGTTSWTKPEPSATSTTMLSAAMPSSSLAPAHAFPSRDRSLTTAYASQQVHPPLRDRSMTTTDRLPVMQPTLRDRSATSAVPVRQDMSMARSISDNQYATHKQPPAAYVRSAATSNASRHPPPPTVRNGPRNRSESTSTRSATESPMMQSAPPPLRRERSQPMLVVDPATVSSRVLQPVPSSAPVSDTSGLTVSERAAQALQQSLVPPPTTRPEALAAAAIQALRDIVTNVSIGAAPVTGLGGNAINTSSTLQMVATQSSDSLAGSSESALSENEHRRPMRSRANTGASATSGRPGTGGSGRSGTGNSTHVRTATGSSTAWSSNTSGTAVSTSRARMASDDEEIDGLTSALVDAIRALLYAVSIPPTPLPEPDGRIPAGDRDSPEEKRSASIGAPALLSSASGTSSVGDAYSSRPIPASASALLSSTSLRPRPSILQQQPQPHPAHVAALKSAQRKVTATLSRLVLSARAVKYDAGSAVPQTLGRLLVDADELEAALGVLVNETARTRGPISDSLVPTVNGGEGFPSSGATLPPPRRTHAVFPPTHLGVGLVGSGAGGSWTGFGFVAREFVDGLVLGNTLDPDAPPVLRVATKGPGGEGMSIANQTWSGGEPRRMLGQEFALDVEIFNAELEKSFTSFCRLVRGPDGGKDAGMFISVAEVCAEGRALIAQLNAFLTFVTNVHVARHVDVDGHSDDDGHVPNDIYMRTVEQARTLVRTLEASVQSIYDDGATLLLTLQTLRRPELGAPPPNAYDHDPSSNTGHDLESTLGFLDVVATSLQANLAVVGQTLMSLLTVGHEQADTAQGEYTGSIEWRLSRMSTFSGVDTRFGGFQGDPRFSMGILSRLSIVDDPIGGSQLRNGVLGQRSFDVDVADNVLPDDDDVVDMETAFASRPVRTNAPAGPDVLRSNGDMPVDLSRGKPPSNGLYDSSAGLNGKARVAPKDDGGVDVDDDDDIEEVKPVKPKQKAKNKNLAKFLGAAVGSAEEEPEVPWYLKSDLDESTTVIDPADGSIKGGTIQALVERLTTHEVPDQTFIKAFMMTFKSFTTVDELFDHLVARFGIKPPPGLAADEFEKWTNLKQKIVQMRVLNTLKSMVTDDDVLDKEDTPILFRMKQFLGREEVAAIPASKHLRILLDRALQSGESGVKMVNKPLGPPPTPVLPKSNKKPKLIDIDALEMARQLTLIESQLFQKIRPMECLQRAREQKQKSESSDNITAVIQTSNRIANWVAEQVLSKEDSRRRASTVKHFIMIADRCRSMNNFSSMIAITSGLNTPPIRRLKRTWEQVPQRYVAMFSTCEQTIDSNKNFTKYRQLMAGVEPPCVPFIGVFLSTLQFIQDGNPDELPGGLVNFRKRQKASEVIMDIKRWQQLSFNFHPILAISTFIEDSLAQFLDERALSDHFWMLSLEREPKEREDEKMARLLQESGFL